MYDIQVKGTGDGCEGRVRGTGTRDGCERWVRGTGARDGYEGREVMEFNK